MVSRQVLNITVQLVNINDINNKYFILRISAQHFFNDCNIHVGNSNVKYFKKLGNFVVV